MLEDVCWHSTDRVTNCRDLGGMTTIREDTGETKCPTEVEMIVDTCRHLYADAVVLETVDHATAVAVNIYDGTYAAEVCDPDAHVPSVVRGLQVRLYSGSSREKSTAYLPMDVVRSATGRWERQIGLVFGKRYAAMLVADSFGGMAPGEVTPDDLERVRLCLSSAIARCLLLEKVDK